MGNEVPQEPLLFLKPPSSLIASGDAIVYPKLSQRVDFEGELGVVIGKRARNVKAADAAELHSRLHHRQRRDGARSAAQGRPVHARQRLRHILRRGPVHRSAKKKPILPRFRIRTLVDGEVKQDGSVTEMLFSVDAIIAYITAVMTLEPGDLIATGTPPGVGPIEPGSKVRVEIAGIGVLENAVVAES